jgi:L-ascorbate metabolism protein UlaG (beta-lactamase superfamily)
MKLHHRTSTTILLLLTIVVGAGVVWLLYPRDFPAYPDSPQYDRAAGIFVNPQPLRELTAIDTVTGVLKLLQGESRYRPSGPLPMQRPDWALFQHDDDTSRFIWFGHSTLLMRIARQTIAVDPVLGPTVSPLKINMRRFQPPAAGLSDWPIPDVVLLTHNHYDHVEAATLKELANSPTTRFITPLGVRATLAPMGVPAEAIIELDWWQSLDHQGVRYTLVPALHASGRSFTDLNKSLWGGFVVQHRAETVYISGDSAYGPHFAEIGRRFPNIGLAFIENGQYDRRWPDVHMRPEESAQAAADVKAAHVVPVHWGAYPMAFHPWDEPVRRIIAALRALRLHPMTPIQGQVFDQRTQTDEWYLDVK